MGSGIVDLRLRGVDHTISRELHIIWLQDCFSIPHMGEDERCIVVLVHPIRSFESDLEKPCGWRLYFPESRETA